MTTAQMTNPMQTKMPIDYSSFMKFSLERNDQGGPSKGRLDLFGYVGGGWFFEGFDENTVKEYLSGLQDEDELEVWVNSYGGNPFCGLAIYDMLSHHKGKVTIHICGMAMSAATLITCAQNAKVTCSVGSILMIHEASASASGKKDKLDNVIKELEAVNASARNIYAQKTGLSADKLQELMSTDYFMTAQEAQELGFVDEIENSSDVNKSISQAGVWSVNGVSMGLDLSKKIPTKFFIPEAPASVTQTTKEDPMDLAKLKAEHAELVDQIRSEAISEERKRIAAIGELTPKGYEQMASEAIQSGTTPEQFAVQVVKAEKEAQDNRIKARTEDASVLKQVTTSTPPVMVGEQDQALADAVIQAGAEGFCKHK